MSIRSLVDVAAQSGSPQLASSIYYHETKLLKDSHLL